MRDFKKDFPIYDNEENLRYFDSGCVTLKPNCVVDKIGEYYTQYPVCSGRSSHYLAKRVDDQVAIARKRICNFFAGKFEEEFIFTRNTTEAINLVANSYNFKGGYVIITDKEHNSNFLPWVRLEEQSKIKLKILQTNAGEIDLDELKQFLEKEDVELVAINYSSNVDGLINPVREIIEIAHENQCLVLLDCAQAAGHIKIDVCDLDVDFLAISGHKMLGPSGVGLLYAKKKLLENMKLFLIGGDTVDDVNYPNYDILDLPNKFEAGLQDYADIIGFGEAVEYLQENFDALENITNENLDYLFEEIKQLPVEVLSNRKNNCGIISFIPNNIDAYELAARLSEHKICCRAGCFCVHNWFHKHDKT